MEYKEYTTIDRAALGWPSGDWDGEPDKVQWQDAETGLPCLAKRHPRFGHWCGYVGVDAEHPLHGKDYDEVQMEIHGGITYAASCNNGDEATGICHIPAAGEPEHFWWLGFDCAHAWDLSPYDMKRAEEGGIWSIGHHQQYRDLPYVKSECASLAKQLKELNT